MRSRRFLSAAGLAALAAMLFAQAAFALAACQPGRALRMLQGDAEAVQCHEPATNANVCLAHCQGRDQTLDKHQLKVPDVSADAVLVVRGAPEFRRPIARAARVPAPIVGPPPRILFRSLLI